MQTVLIVIHLIVVVSLVGVVLLQRSEGGALGVGGGGGFMTGRGQANALSRATAILATLFFVTSLTMSIIAGWSRAPSSIIDNASQSTAGKTAPGQGGSLLDQLKGGKAGETSPGGLAPSTTAPANDAAPAAPAPASDSAPAAPAPADAPK